MGVTARRNGRIGSVLVAGVFALVLVAPEGRARADATEEARAYTDKATAAFALAHYAVAADYFEKAFELRPDPALLYNAAQSHRQAGNKERALVLYKNYLRLYAKKDKRAEIEARIDELEKAIAHDKAAQARPPTSTDPAASAPPDRTPPPVAPLGPTTPAPAAGAAPPPPAAVTPAPDNAAASTAPTLVAQPAPPAPDDSLFKKPWFWIATGAGAAVAVTVVLMLTMGGTTDPSPSVGRINAN